MLKILKSLCSIIILCGAVGSCFLIKPAYAQSLEFYSDAYLLADYYANRPLVSKNITKHMPVASITKLMTALLVFEKIQEKKLDLNTSIIASENAQMQEGSSLKLIAGKTYSLQYVLTGLLVVSGNDCAVAISEHIFGTEYNAVTVMNQRAVELGMQNTHFVNSSGLPSPEDYSCAFDIMILIKEISKHDLFLQIAKIHTFNNKKSTNKMLNFNGMIAGKTGTTFEAGYCFASIAERNGVKLISVVLNSKSAESRFSDTEKLYDFGFANFEVENILCQEEFLDISYRNGKFKKLKAKCEDEIKIIKLKGANVSVFVKSDEISAPIVSGQKVGEIIVAVDGIVELKRDLISSEKYDRHSYFDLIKKFAEKF